MKDTELLEQMTLEEKAMLLGGRNMWETYAIKRLGIPSMFCSDGPHGLRKQSKKGNFLGIGVSEKAVCFPTASCIACSWDEKLGEEIGRALAEEAAALNVQILLGPGLNIKRSPLCGRNFEYFSEDPYLSGKMAAAYIRGIQSRGIAACAKHFAVNSREKCRMAMNAAVDERTLREIYLTGFEIAVKEGAALGVMSSYNEVNGVYVSENSHLLQEILRDEWGFHGIVITDWGASNDHVEGVKAGCNLEMPHAGKYAAESIIRAVREGRLKKDTVNQRVLELLRVIRKTSGPVKRMQPAEYAGRHHKLAGKAADQSMVLLKNEQALLPLKPGCRVAVIGDFVLQPRYQGAGSSLVNPFILETAAQEAVEQEIDIIGVSRGYRRQDVPDQRLEQEALRLAEKSDVVILFLGLTEASEAEGKDRAHMRIPDNQVRLLQQISRVNPQIAVVLSAGSAVEMPWIGYCMALLNSFLGGEAGAGAVWRILTGQVCPSGKLTETYPMRYEDTPAYRYYNTDERTSEYREALFVGYRYYDTVKKDVLFPFGFGLSYTEFAYSELAVDKDGVQFTVENIGSVAGAEIAQMYVHLNAGRVFRPEKELKGFCKVYLKPGEKRRVKIQFDAYTFRFWNTAAHRWDQEGGMWTVMIGASCADIRLQTDMAVSGTAHVFPKALPEISRYFSGDIHDISRETFECLYGKELPVEDPYRELDINDPLRKMRRAKARGARVICRLIEVWIWISRRMGKPGVSAHFVYDMPFRGLAKLTGGLFNMQMAQGMCDLANRKIRCGIRQFVAGMLRRNHSESAKKNGK